jgi:hypothetical protein
MRRLHSLLDHQQQVAGQPVEVDIVRSVMLKECSIWAALHFRR